MTDKSVTFVTGFWDPSALGRSNFRSAAAYIRLFEEVYLSLPHPLVVYIDTSLVGDLRTALAKHKRTGSCRIVPVPVSDVPRMEDREKFRRLLRMKNYGCEAEKVTLDFAIVTWAKTDLVARTAESNPFGSSHFAWIDFGIAHICDPTSVDWHEMLTAVSDRVRICEMRATSSSEISSLTEYYSYNRGKVASGLFTGSQASVIELAKLFDSEVERMRDAGYYVLEEQLFAAIATRTPELFERWYAYYTGVLANYAHIRCDADVVLGNLENCRAHGISERGSDITRALLKSATKRKIYLYPAQVARLLFEGLICAYYHDRDLATDLGRVIACLFKYSAVMRSAFSSYGSQLGKNLSFVGVDLDDEPPLSWAEFAAREDSHVWLPCL